MALPKIFSNQFSVPDPLLLITLISSFFSAADCSALLCPRLTVDNADYADCGGEYEASQVCDIFIIFYYMYSSYLSQDIRVDWAPERVVYKHTEKDR